MSRAQRAALFRQSLDEFVRDHGIARSALNRLYDFADSCEHGAIPATAPPLQRPVVAYFSGLHAAPFHFADRAPLLARVTHALEPAFSALRREALATVGSASFTDYVASARHRLRPGTWSSGLIRANHRIYRRRFPVAARLLAQIEDDLVPGGEAFYSVLAPGTAIPAHHDGTNAQLTCHLPLVSSAAAGLEVGGETVVLEEGRCLFFDHSFRHRAWNDGPMPRILLLVAVRHPDVTPLEWDALRMFSLRITELSGEAVQL